MGNHARNFIPSTARRILIGAAAAVTLGAGGTLAYSAGADASTTPQPSAHSLMGAIKSGATMSVDGIAYRAAPVSRPTCVKNCPPRGYWRTCRDFRAWNAAGIPSWGQLRRMAHSAATMRTGPRSLLDDTLQADVAYLVLTVTGGTGGSQAAVVVAHDCGND